MLPHCRPIATLALAAAILLFFPAAAEVAAQETGATSRPATPTANADPVAARAKIREALVAEQTDAALELIEPWLASHPRDPGFHALHGEIFFAREQFQEAVQAFERAVALAPHYRGKLFNFGRALQGLDQHERAIGIFQAMLESSQKHLQVRGYFGIGLSRQALGNDEGAIVVFRASLAIDPNFTRSIYRLALIRIAQGDDAEAEKELAQVLEQDPLHHGAAYNRALALGRLERPEEESEAAWTRYRAILEGKQRITSLRERLTGTRDDFVALVELGEIHLELGVAPKALEWFGRAAAIDAFDPRPAVGTVAGLRALGNDVDAERLCTVLLERTPPMEELRAPLIELLEKRGAAEEAAKWRKPPAEATPAPPGR